MWLAIIGLAKWLGGKVFEHVEQKTRLKAARIEADIAVEAKRATANIDWDQIHATASATSWKDEFWTIILAFPLFVVFYATLFDRPELLDRLRTGFEVLGDLPPWYLAAIGIAIGAAFGYRRLVDFMTRKGAGKGKGNAQA